MTAQLTAWAAYHDRRENLRQTYELLHRTHAGRCYYCEAPATQLHHAFTAGHPLRLTCKDCHDFQHALHREIKRIKGNYILSNKGE